MADIINLRRARRAKGRQEAQKVSEANRLTYGVSKVERSLARAETQRAAERLAGHRRDKDDSEDPSAS
jgi:hypothetical protein